MVCCLYSASRHEKNVSALFPNYVFVRMSSDERRKVISTPGVLAIVGGKEPTPLPDIDIEVLRVGINTRKIEPHPDLTIGEAVRIAVGPFEGVSGILMRQISNYRVRYRHYIHYEKHRVGRFQPP
jgi:transcription antitermination factor NusG